MDQSGDTPESIYGVYSIKDVYCAAYLLYCGCELFDVKRVDYQSEFFFRNVPQNAIKAFYNREVQQLSARELFDAYKAVRSRSTYVRQM